MEFNGIFMQEHYFDAYLALTTAIIIEFSLGPFARIILKIKHMFTFQ